MIKRGGWVKLCWNDFLSKYNKKVRNVCELPNYDGMNFLAKQTTKCDKKWGMGQIMLE